MNTKVFLRLTLGLLLAVSAFALPGLNSPPAAHAAATVQSPAPTISWMTPYPVPLGAFTLTVNGANFLNGAIVRWGDTPLPTSYVSSSVLTATGNATQSGSVFITVLNPGSPGVLSSPKLLEVGQGIVVTISPTSAAVVPGAKKQFTATVTGAANAGVWWYVNNSSSGNSVAGTITQGGLYTAPNTAPASPIKITAISQANSARSATATVTVSGSPSPTPTPTPVGVAVTISPSSASVTAGTTKQFSATVTGTANTAVTWQVNNVTGGNATVGTISNSGLYTAPNAVPAGAVTVTAVSQADNTKSASAPITVTAPPVTVAVSINPTTANVATGMTQQFTATVTGTANTAVTWKVNNVAGGDPVNGTVTSGGVYTAPATIPSGGVVTVTAVSQADATKQASASVTVQDPQLASVGRFLDQCTFGATPSLIAHVKQVGFQGFLNEQFSLPESPLPAPSSATNSGNIDAMFDNAVNGQDQLRQRVIFAFSEIFVEAMNKNYNANMIAPWRQLLSRNAFGNFRTLLKELSNDSSMGQFLDLANSGVFGGAANENYPREVMQLFSIGLFKLNPDGSQQLDASNQPIPTYTQTDVQQMALAFTGWTYDNATHTTGNGNYNYYPGPLLPMQSKHNTSQKTILGQTLPAGQTIQQDLDGAINILFNHPNVGPFMATRLIRALVTSNPSPAYIARVTAVFNDNGLGVRGDLRAVVNAILMDQEARNDTPPSNFGRLRTPVQTLAAMSRCLSLPVGAASQFNYQLYNMGEAILDAPSVFGHYSPSFRIPKGNGLFGPEFQIYTPTEAANRGNFLYQFVAGVYPVNPALQPLVNIAGSPTALVNAVDNMLLYGRMSVNTRSALYTALPTMPSDIQRVYTALYLTLTSGEFLVQH